MMNLRNLLWSVWNSFLIFKIVVLWGVTPCDLLVRYKCFGGTCYLHLQDIKVILILWRWSQSVPLKHCYFPNKITRRYIPEDLLFFFLPSWEPQISHFWTSLSTFCQLLGLIWNWMINWKAELWIGRGLFYAVSFSLFNDICLAVDGRNSECMELYLPAPHTPSWRGAWEQERF